MDGGEPQFRAFPSNQLKELLPISCPRWTEETCKGFYSRRAMAEDGLCWLYALSVVMP